MRCNWHARCRGFRRLTAAGETIPRQMTDQGESAVQQRSGCPLPSARRTGIGHRGRTHPFLQTVPPACAWYWSPAQISSSVPSCMWLSDACTHPHTLRSSWLAKPVEAALSGWLWQQDLYHRVIPRAAMALIAVEAMSVSRCTGRVRAGTARTSPRLFKASIARSHTHQSGSSNASSKTCKGLCIVFVFKISIAQRRINVSSSRISGMTASITRGPPMFPRCVRGAPDPPVLVAQGPQEIFDRIGIADGIENLDGGASDVFRLIL